MANVAVVAVLVVGAVGVALLCAVIAYRLFRGRR
jgi:hypothetical protein